MLLGDNTMFVCELPIRLLLKIWRVYDVFHASLTSDFFGWSCWYLSSFNGPWVVVWPPSELDFLDVVENTFALLQSRVIDCDSNRVESFCENHDSSCDESPFFSMWLESGLSHKKSWLESSHWLKSRYHCLALLVYCYRHVSIWILGQSLKSTS